MDNSQANIFAVQNWYKSSPKAKIDTSSSSGPFSLRKMTKEELIKYHQDALSQIISEEDEEKDPQTPRVEDLGFAAMME